MKLGALENAEAGPFRVGGLLGGEVGRIGPVVAVHFFWHHPCASKRWRCQAFYERAKTSSWRFQPDAATYKSLDLQPLARGKVIRWISSSLLCCLVMGTCEKTHGKDSGTSLWSTISIESFDAIIELRPATRSLHLGGTSGKWIGDGWIVLLQHGSVGPFRVSTTISFKFKHVLCFLSFGPLVWLCFFCFMAVWGRNHLENDNEDINLGFGIIGRLRLIYQALTWGMIRISIEFLKRERVKDVDDTRSWTFKF